MRIWPISEFQNKELTSSISNSFLFGSCMISINPTLINVNNFLGLQIPNRCLHLLSVKQLLYFSRDRNVFVIVDLEILGVVTVFCETSDAKRGK